jgi:hypothetical protein
LRWWIIIDSALKDDKCSLTPLHLVFDAAEGSDFTTSDRQQCKLACPTLPDPSQSRMPGFASR